MRFFNLWLLILVLFMPACTSAAAGLITPTMQPVNQASPPPEPSTGLTPTGEPAGPAHSQSALANTRWTLVSFGSPGAETPVITGSNVTLEFKTEGQVTGSGGCNSYSGKYLVQDNTLSFSQINSTLMACADAQVTEQEQSYFQALPSAGKFELRDDRLTISSADGQSVLNFSLASTPPPSPTESQPAPAPTEEAYENLNSPVDLLASYVNAINRQEYQRAYGYWENPPNSYEDFVAGFSDTANVQLIVQPPTRIEGAAGSLYVAIPTVFVDLHRDGSQHTFAGCFTTRKSNLHPPDIPKEDVWHLYQAQMASVPNDGIIQALLAHACPS